MLTHIVRALSRVYDLREGLSKLQKITRNFAAIAALLALLLPGVSALAETFSAAELPACCNTAYCPLHHRQISDVQRDKNNCGAMGAPGQHDCSMRACDAAATPIVGAAQFVLVTPIDLLAPIVAEATISLALQHFPVVTSVPLTPPPQFLLS
ncbi:MAG TPA: hypothetical protein VK709_06310 [Candidatus Saccharimonadales bacterium]|nr:hypothetical protein [Candidatus Saccharimonadales bacterium]